MLVGHDDLVELLLSRIRCGDLMAPWLFLGRKGLGKATLAINLSYFMVNDHISQGRIDKMARHDFTDPIFQSHAKGVIGGQAQGIKYVRGDTDTMVEVDQIRSIGNILSVTSAAGTGRHVVIVDGVNHVNNYAQHALLKMLEDHCHSTHFILIAHGEHDVIPTVRSRCMAIPFAPLGAPDLKKILDHLHRPLECHEGVNQHVNRCILQCGSVQDALWLHHALCQNPDIWHSHLETWMQILQNPRCELDFSSMVNTWDGGDIHKFLFLWQLHRIINFIFLKEAGNMALCRRESQLWQLGSKYALPTWLMVGDGSQEIVRDSRYASMNEESQLMLLFGNLGTSLTAVTAEPAG